jgi:septum formation inhibitor MinC
MVSIGGVFAIAEDIEPTLIDKPAMVWLEGHGLRFTAV